MSPLKSNVIQDKLFKLNENVTFLEDILTDSDERILKDMSRCYALEHILQLSIQIVLDIGAHILAEEYQENPATYQEVIIALGNRGLVSKEFAAEQAEMAKFRNKLIHDYDSVDKEKVLIYARSAPAIFRVFGKAYRDFIEKKN
jgi:uncharacterized protein YutE (UPF0331/DUF86 family)